MISGSYSAIIQLSKYVIVGFLNALFTVAVYFICLKVIEFHYLLSFTISWISGVVLTYIINFLWVFKPENNITFYDRFAKYFLVYFSSYLINLSLLKAITDATEFDPLYVQLFLLPLVVLINFYGIKNWSLNKRPRQIQ